MLVCADVFVLIEYFSQVLWLSVAACVLGLLQLRRTKPNLHRPITVPLVIPYLFLIACVVLVAVPAWNDPIKSCEYTYKRYIRKEMRPMSPNILLCSSNRHCYYLNGGARLLHIYCTNR